MKKHYNIILANAPINNGNRGCVALSITTMYIINKIMKKFGVTYNIYMPDSQHGDCKEHEYNVLGELIKYTDIKYYRKYDVRYDSKQLLIQLFKGIDYSQIYKNADCILDIGQGDSFSDIYGEDRFKMIDLIHQYGKRLSKPYCILPQTIGPFTDLKIKTIADESIALSSLCMARDKQSYDYVVKNVPSQSSVKEYIDVAFFMPYEKFDHGNDLVHVGINISALLWNGGYRRNNQFGLKSDYKEIVRSIIDYFLSKHDVKVHLVPHVVLQERNIENDYEVSYELWKEYNNSRLVLAPFALGPIEIKSYISGLDFFMGARMHATIGAFSSGVPVVPMAYSRKFNGLFEDSLNYQFMADLKAQTSEAVLDIICRAYDMRTDLKTVIKDRMDTIVSKREKLMIEELSNFFISI